MTTLVRLDFADFGSPERGGRGRGRGGRGQGGRRGRRNEDPGGRGQGNDGPGRSRVSTRIESPISAQPSRVERPPKSPFIIHEGQIRQGVIHKGQIRQKDIPVCTLLTPLVFLQQAAIPYLHLDNTLIEGVNFDGNKIEIVVDNVIKALKEYLNSIHIPEHDIVIPKTIEDTVREKNRHIYHHQAYEVFTAFIITIYFATKEKLPLKDANKDFWNPRWRFFNIDDLKKLRIHMGDHINFAKNKDADPDFDHFLTNGRHSNNCLPPFAVYDMLNDILGELKIDHVKSDEWCKGDHETVKKVQTVNENIEDKIVTELKEKVNKKVVCKGGMIKSVYYKETQNKKGKKEYESFNHAFAFTYDGNNIHVFDTFDQTQNMWGNRLSFWTNNEYAGYTRNVIGAFAFLHSKEAFPEEAQENLAARLEATESQETGVDG